MRTSAPRSGRSRCGSRATSASRDAANAAEFVAGSGTAFARFGTSPEVITGDEEATLSFRGATGDLVAAGIDGPYLVVDLGGGSTEFVRGTASVEAALSVDIGCVRMTERHLHSDPPTADEIAAATADIEAAVSAALQAVPAAGVRDPGRTGRQRHDGDRAGVVAAHLRRPPDPPGGDAGASGCGRRPVTCSAMTRAHRAALPFMHPGRVDVIGAGALVWDVVIREVAEASGLGDRLTVVSSEHDILDGLALSLV